MLGIDYLKRLRSTRGFGVHSPLAFRMVTQVLRQDYAYYASGRLAELDTRGLPEHFADILFRLVCEFSPAAVWISPDLPRRDAVAEAVRLADSRTRFTSRPAEAQMIVATDTLPLVPDHGVAVMASSCSPGAFEGIERGCFTFSNGTWLVGVSRPDLPRQHFEVLF